MIKIYAIPVSLYCAKLRTLLRHKKLQWEEVPPPGGYGSDAYKTVVPSGNLPAMVDGDLCLGDSEAIAEYLNEAYPENPLLPDDIAERAKVRELSRFHDTRLEPALRKSFAYLPPVMALRNVIEVVSKDINAKLLQLEDLLKTNETHSISGLTLADCGYPITFAWIEALENKLGLTIVWPASVLTYREKIEEYPAIIEELSSYVPKLSAFLNNKEEEGA